MLVKSGKSFRKIFTTPIFDLCSFASGTLNPSLSIFFEQMSADKPIVQKCPWENKIDFPNFDVRGDKSFGIYAAGVYKISVLFGKQKNKANLCAATATISYKLGKKG